MFRTISLLFLSLVPLLARAVEVTSPTGNLPWLADPNSRESSATVIASLIRFWILFSAVIAIIAIVWAGIQMILATGEDEKIKKSRKIIMFALIGLVITGLAYAVVDIIANLNLRTLQP